MKDQMSNDLNDLIEGVKTLNYDNIDDFKKELDSFNFEDISLKEKPSDNFLEAVGHKIEIAQLLIESIKEIKKESNVSDFLTTLIEKLELRAKQMKKYLDTVSK